jgi:hypothetical protein
MGALQRIHLDDSLAACDGTRFSCLLFSWIYFGLCSFVSITLLILICIDSCILVIVSFRNCTNYSYLCSSLNSFMSNVMGIHSLYHHEEIG